MASAEGSMSSDSKRPPKFVYELPYKATRELCQVLDMNRAWEELGGLYLEFSAPELYEFQRAIYHEFSGGSPTQAMLTRWGYRNGTIDRLYISLFKMQHNWAMSILQAYVSPQYRHLLSNKSGSTTMFLNNQETRQAFSSNNTKWNYSSANNKSDIFVKPVKKIPIQDTVMGTFANTITKDRYHHQAATNYYGGNYVNKEREPKIPVEEGIPFDYSTQQRAKTGSPNGNVDRCFFKSLSVDQPKLNVKKTVPSQQNKENKFNSEKLTNPSTAVDDMKCYHHQEQPMSEYHLKNEFHSQQHQSHQPTNDYRSQQHQSHQPTNDYRTQQHQSHQPTNEYRSQQHQSHQPTNDYRSQQHQSHQPTNDYRSQQHQSHQPTNDYRTQQHQSHQPTNEYRSQQHQSHQPTNDYRSQQHQSHQPTNEYHSQQQAVQFAGRANPNESVAPSIRRPSDPLSSVGSQPSLPQISFKEIEHCTNNFSNVVLGKGGFGIVYAGVWKHTPVAIKRIQKKENPGLTEIEDAKLQQSLIEVRALDGIRHLNIVTLMGYSLNQDGLCLIYELMPNGSLEDRLQCRDKTPPLSWIQRCSIVVGAARGIQYLHTLYDRPLIHGDIKSANILLDETLEPKLGDFGLIREGPPSEKTHTYVKYVNGTRAYLPLEYLQNNKLSTRVDTYSFGVVLFEVCTGLRAYDETRAKEKKCLSFYVRGCDEPKLINLRDQKGGSKNESLFKDLIQVGFMCTKDEVYKRPEMVTVFKQLESVFKVAEVKNKVENQDIPQRDSSMSPYERQVRYDVQPVDRRRVEEMVVLASAGPELSAEVRGEMTRTENKPPSYDEAVAESIRQANCHTSAPNAYFPAITELNLTTQPDDLDSVLSAKGKNLNLG